MDEEQTKYCEMENGCMFCDKLLCEGKKEEPQNDFPRWTEKEVTKHEMGRLSENGFILLDGDGKQRTDGYRMP